LLNLQFNKKHHTSTVKFYLDNYKLSNVLSGPPVGGPLSAVETCQRPQDLTAFKKDRKEIRYCFQF